jgi:phenylacetate-coenzyme A ligase PaaK-like adenylate-forming protein
MTFGDLHDEVEIEAGQLDRLKAFLPVVAARHPRYASVLSGLGITDWTRLEDLDAIPLTDKADLAADPDGFRLRSEDGGFPVAWDVVYTSGTTGPPVPIHQSAHDYRRILFAQRRMAEIRGLDSHDTIANLFPVAARPNGSWLRVNDHALAIGARLVAGMGGPDAGTFSPTRRLDDVVRVVTEARPSVLWGVGSYIRRFLSACEGAGRRLPTVRMVVASGEALDPAIEHAIRTGLAALGAPSVTISHGFGASELQCSLVPCEEGAGLHNPAPELFLLQTVDDDGATLPSGSPGRLVLTHLDRTGTVLLRYALGDVVTLARDACPSCGRAGERIVAHHGRGDSRVKIRGQLVDLEGVSRMVAADPDVIEHTVAAIEADPGAPAGMDALRIRIAVRAGSDGTAVAERVARAVREAAAVRPEVLVGDPDSIYAVDDTMKPTRIRTGR